MVGREFVSLFWPLAVLLWANVGSAQEAGDGYQFTMSLSPPPTPGKPFTITWSGGQPTEPVYIILNYLFPDTPNQDIQYINIDLLSNAPNNGSWIWNVPGDLEPGRYELSIGENPLLESASTSDFTITPSEITGSGQLPTASANTAAAPSYRGCGLPPLPDYTYTGYQAPCTTTTNGQVETLYPIVPATDSSAFYGTSWLNQPPAPPTTSSTSQTTSTSSQKPENTAFATGVLAQDLQCSTVVNPSTSSLVISDTTTVISSVGCGITPAASSANANAAGVCHTSGYSTFSLSGSTSVCCPSGWATTPLSTEIYCFTSINPVLYFSSDGAQKRQAVETYVRGSETTVVLSKAAFTSAGIVIGGASSVQASATPSSSSVTGSSSAGGMSRSTSSLPTATATSVDDRTKTSSSGLGREISIAWVALGFVLTLCWI